MKDIFDFILYLHGDIDTRNSISLGNIAYNNDTYDLRWNTCMDGGGFYIIKNNHIFFTWSDITDNNIKEKIKELVITKIKESYNEG